MRTLILEDSGAEAWFLNHQKPRFDDPRVRRAVFLAVNRDNAVQKSILGFGSPGTFFAPGVVEDLSELRANSPAFMLDRGPALEEARGLLAEAGFPDGFELTVNVVNSNPALSMAEALAAQFREDLGLEAVLQPTDLPTMYVGMRDGVANVDGVGTGIILRDPGDIINQFYLQDVLRNPHNWQNGRVDELIDLQNRAIDPTERQGHLEELASILHRGESHWLPVFWNSNGGGFDCRIQNYCNPPTVQLIKKWDHVWWAGGEPSDCDHNANSERGYRP